MQTIVVTDSDRIWHNSTNPNDVNNDGLVLPIDALLVVNFLNAYGSGPVPMGNPPPYLDVDGDNFISPVDALMVINLMNAQPTGQGEYVADIKAANDLSFALTSLPLDQLETVVNDALNSGVESQLSLIAPDIAFANRNDANQLAALPPGRAATNNAVPFHNISTNSIDDYFVELGSEFMLRVREVIAQNRLGNHFRG